MNKYAIFRDSKSYAHLLQFCINTKNLQRGKLVHADMITAGFEPGTFLWNRLITLYERCGSIEDAHQVFDKMPQRNTCSWNVMISGYNGCGRILDARKLFDKMPERDTVSWNTMIAGYAQNGHSEESLKMFGAMHYGKVKANQYSFASVLSCCGDLSVAGEGKQVHTYIIKSGFEFNVVLLNAVIDMYSKCRDMESARRVFDKMPQRGVKLFDKLPQRDVVSWTAMIAGYAQGGHGEEALKLFSKMRSEAVRPDVVVFPIVLSSSANLAALSYGKQVHAYVFKSGIESNVFVASALVNMYAKCGNTMDGSKVFANMKERNVVSWNTMISGFAQNGHSREALQLYEEMVQTGIRPNYVTFIGVLSACCHQGLVDEGCFYFDSMVHDHGIRARADHYACMVDLYGRAGLLKKAEELVKSMSFEADAVVWGALLGAARMHDNLEVGKLAAEHLFKLEPHRAGPYILLSNMYASARRWDVVAKMRKEMRDKGVKKEPGCSWVEMGNKVYTFVTGDRSHPQTEEIYAMLEGLAGKIKAAGYVPDMNFVLQSEWS